jgi:CBS domain containing-hemolysin-like protein
MEDILEEIVGEINDEYDEEERNFVRINSNTYVFEGKTLLSDFYKVLKLDDDIFKDVEGDADTLAGLLLELKGDFPTVHEKLDYQQFTFEIMELDERRISKVKVIVHEPLTDTVQ